MLIKLELTLSNVDGSDRLLLRKGLRMDGFFKIVLAGAVGAALGILSVKKQMFAHPDERATLSPAAPEAVQAPPVQQAPPAAPFAVPLPPQAPPAPAVPTYVVPVAPAIYAPLAAPAPASAPVYAPPVAPAPVYAPPVAPAPAPVFVPPTPMAPAPAPAAPTPVAPDYAEPPVFAQPQYVAPVPAPQYAPPAPMAPAPAYAPPVETPPVAAAPPVAAVAPATVPPAPAAEMPAVDAAPPAGPVFEAPPAQVFIEREPDVVAESDAAIDAMEPEVEEMLFAAGVIDGMDSDVVVTPGVLDEPVPGAGWEPKAMLFEDEAELEALLPASQEDILPYEAPLVGDSRSFATEDAWFSAGWPEIAEAAAAESVASMEDDLREPEGFLAEPAATETAAIEPIEMETEPAFRAAPAFQVPPEPVISPTLDGPEQGEPDAEAALGEDLKSRIEETRRRIREELDKPFAAVDEPETSEPVRPSAAAAPVIGDAMRTGAPANDGFPAQPAAPEQEAQGGNGTDYDAMRARIELTRSRLKAKAFDAMMAGESALLGRDPSDELTGSTTNTTAFDSEIERTVDSTLREEDR